MLNNIYVSLEQRCQSLVELVCNKPQVLFTTALSDQFIASC